MWLDRILHTSDDDSDDWCEYMNGATSNCLSSNAETSVLRVLAHHFKKDGD
jgi:hypothetical protein